MIRFPNAKINLGLHITGKRPDGFHDVETVFYPVSWCDALEIIPSAAKESTLEVFDADFGDSKMNLCFRAWNILKTEYSLPDISMYLQKIIPHGAGLGGGSSDAAFVLMIVNEIFHLNLSKIKLAEYAAQLGSDCPFFIYNTPMMATGRGELLSPINVSLKKYYLMIVMPDVMVSTADAYSMIEPKKPDLQLSAVLQLPVNQWKYALVNDFEDRVFGKYPEIRELKERLYESGALYASMSGSGSSVFGVFEKETMPVIEFKNYKVWQGKG